MAEPPRALLAHALPGRTRLRLPALRGDAAGMARLAAAVAALPGVASAEASALTGSLLVRHEGEAPALAAAAAAAGLFALGRGPGPAAAPPLPPEALWPATGAAAAGLLAVAQLLRQDLLPPALTLAAEAFRMGRAAWQAGQGGPAPGDGPAAGTAGDPARGAAEASPAAEAK